MLDEEDLGLPYDETDPWAPGEYEAYAESIAKWHRSKKLVSKLSNGKVVWACAVYEKRTFGDIIERIDEAEYLVRKLAGTLKTEYNFSDWR